MADETSVIRQFYDIVSICQAEPPAGREGSNWYSYVIAHGKNTINGYRQGDLEAVTTAVEKIVAQLNERQFGNFNPAPTPKKDIKK